MGERRGLGHFLTGLRLALSNPVTRRILGSSVREASCRIPDEDVEADKKPIVYYALASFAGRTISDCPLQARFISGLIKSLLRVSLWIIRGDTDEARKALRDPAVRRGITLVLEGIARYGITVPQKLPAPFLVVWNFTNMCNLRCMHCYQRASKPTPDELTLEEKLGLVDQLDKAGVAAVALSGGEPTIHPHFIRVVRALSSRGIYVSVATNGWAFADKKRLEEAVKAGLRYVEVSLDSSRPEVHDKFRGVRGTWERAVKALRNAVELGVTAGIAVTITRINVDEVDEILDLAEEIGVKRVVFFNFIPVGRGKDNAWLDLEPEEREKLLQKLYMEHKRRGLEIYSTSPIYSRVALQLSRGETVSPTHFYIGENKIVKALAEYVGGCGAGRIYAAVQPNGDVTPCVFMPIVVGNVREKEFREIWETTPLFNKLRDRSNLWGPCRVCSYRNVCGGCRARGYAYFNDPLAPDPGCILARKYWHRIVGKQREEITYSKPRASPTLAA